MVGIYFFILLELDAVFIVRKKLDELLSMVENFYKDNIHIVTLSFTAENKI